MNTIDFFRKIQADLELAEFVKVALGGLRKPHETYASCLHRIIDKHRRMVEEEDG